MLRYQTKTRPGLVALYDIRPGNGAGPFLQPRSPHGATGARNDGGGNDKWSYRTCKATVKSSPPTNQHPVLYGPDVLSVILLIQIETQKHEISINSAMLINILERTTHSAALVIF